MTASLKTIDQTGVQALIRERLEHPERYADTPLFIWQAEWHDGIQQKLIVDASLDFNRGKAREQWSYFHLTSVVYDNACLGTPHDKGHLVGNIINPRNLSLDEYLRIVSKLIDDNNSSLPMIVYLPYGYQSIDLPGEQYISNPDFEHWAKDWADSIIPDFIRGDGDKAAIIYRWYNRYNDCDKGCSIPLIWFAVGSFLNGFVKLTKNFRRNYDIVNLDEDLIRAAFHAGVKASEGYISNDVITEFLKHLKSPQFTTPYN